VFTGIVEELGEVVEVQRHRDAARITVAGSMVTADARHGDSIAVNGVCLTVAELAPPAFTADVMRETLRRTNLGELDAGDQVNLERAATLDHRLGGHLVQGHVDGVGQVCARQAAPEWELVRIAMPAELSRYVVPQGSIAVDGVSLTVVTVDGDEFTVSLIPTTLRLTTLGRRTVGQPVNVEVDVIAKYVERLAAAYLRLGKADNGAVESGRS
jgi:riboflavin synthase